MLDKKYQCGTCSHNIYIYIHIYIYIYIYIYTLFLLFVHSDRYDYNESTFLE